MTVAEISTLMTTKEGAGYICVNKALMRNLGNDAAIVYAELVRNYLYYEKQGTLTDDKYFFCTVESLEENCNVSKAQQNAIFKKLASLGLVKLDYRGLPKRRYVYLSTDENAVQAAFTGVEKQKAAKTKMPDDVRKKYSKEFDMEILKKQIAKAVKENQMPVEFVDKILELYSMYFGYFGMPYSYLSTNSVKLLVDRIKELDSSYYVLDKDFFEGYLDEYANTDVEGKGYVRSINNLLSESMIEVLYERLK